MGAANSPPTANRRSLVSNISTFGADEGPKPRRLTRGRRLGPSPSVDGQGHPALIDTAFRAVLASPLSGAAPFAPALGPLTDGAR